MSLAVMSVARLAKLNLPGCVLARERNIRPLSSTTALKTRSR
jgi:hypothetical protein